eukprot:GHVR01180802.1.p1 GENE.GHVR01180802.1~~GHVR01180802.1.p1  ORF type:complete len:392 (+),score=107.15 GHVR01180802.1:46-1221(+)
MNFSDIGVAEANSLIVNLRKFEVYEIGTSEWVSQHEVLERLNVTSHTQAKTKHDEFIVDEFINEDKITTLIHELIVIEGWKDLIHPHLRNLMSNLPTIKSYIPLYHESVIVNMLEMFLYHARAAEACGDTLDDLLAYCAAKLLKLNNTPKDELTSVMGSIKDELELTAIEDHDRMKRDCDFGVCMSCIVLVRMIADHAHTHTLPPSIFNTMLNTHDFPLLLAPLLDIQPWHRHTQPHTHTLTDTQTHTTTPQLQRYEESQWKRLESCHDPNQLPLYASQVLLALYSLVMSEECARNYQLNSSRKAALLKIRPYLNECVLDQLPPLLPMRRTLEEISIRDGFPQPHPHTHAPPPNIVLVQNLPCIRTYVRNMCRRVETRNNIIMKFVFKIFI